MAAYCYFDILKVYHKDVLDNYHQKILDTVDKYDGRFVIIGGRCDIKEGNWQPVFPVMIEFPTMDKANEWYNSLEYSPLKALRLFAVEANAVFIQGI